MSTHLAYGPVVLRDEYCIEQRIFTFLLPGISDYERSPLGTNWQGRAMTCLPGPGR